MGWVVKHVTDIFMYIYLKNVAVNFNQMTI